MRLKQYNEAHVAFSKAIELEPHNADLFDGLQKANAARK